MKYFTGGASFMDAGLGYEIGLLTPDRPGDYYRVFVRVFRGKPFKTPLIGRFEMICPVVK
jgi:hypothetical protein